MRADCLSNASLTLVVGLAAASLVACGSSNKNNGSRIQTDGGAGSGGSAGSSTGGTGGQATGGAGGQASGGMGGQATGGAGGAMSCSDFGQTKACTSCLESKCCADVAACSADAACKAFITCSESCTPYYNVTTTCSKACQSKNPNGYGADYRSLILCTQNKCASSCKYP